MLPRSVALREDSAHTGVYFGPVIDHEHASARSGDGGGVGLKMEGAHESGVLSKSHSHVSTWRAEVSQTRKRIFRGAAKSECRHVAFMLAIAKNSRTSSVYARHSP